MSRALFVPSGGARPAFVLALLLCLHVSAFAQVFDWTKTGGGEGWKHGHAIASDGSGNSYVVGKFAAQPGGQSSNLISFGGPPLTVAGAGDAFVAMYNAGGNVREILQIRSLMPGDAVTATGISLVGNTLYITGEISGQVDFGDGVSFVSNPALPRSSYIARISVDHTSSTNPLVVEAAALISPNGANNGTCRASAITVYGAYVYITGEVDGQISMLSWDDPTIVDETAPSTPGMFIARYTTGLLAQDITLVKPEPPFTSPASASFGTAITAGPGPGPGPDEDVRVYATGYYRGRVSMNSAVLDGEINEDNLIVASVDEGGGLPWLTGAKRHASSQTGHIVGRGIALNSQGDLYITGEVGGKVGFSNGVHTLTSAGQSDFYIAKIGGLSGNVQNAVIGGATSTSRAFANAIAIRDVSPREIYVTGAIAGSVVSGDITVTSMGNHDVLVARFDEPANGQFSINWMRRAGNRSLAAIRTHQDQGTGISVAPTNPAVYMVGEYGGVGDPDDAEFFPYENVSGNHFRNVFVSRLSQNAMLVRGQVRFMTSGGLIPSGRHHIRLSLQNAGAGAESDEVLTGADGWYTVYAPAGKTYKLEAERVSHTSMSLPWPGTFYQLDTPTTTANFMFDSTATDSADLRIEITPVGAGYAMPESQRCYRITYKNHGSGALFNGATITMTHDVLLKDPITASIEGPATEASTSPLVWTIPGVIQPMDDGEIIVCFDFPQTDPEAVPPTPPIGSGEILSSSVEIVGPGEDGGFLGDNFASIDDDVFFPLDPNLKASNPVGNLDVVDVRNGRGIEYMIDFYNVGPNRAQKVTVVDEFTTAHFLVGTGNFLDVLAASPSNPAPPFMTGSTATFEFLNANLLGMPQSVAGSRGFIRFNAKLNTGLAVGTVVTNSADVQFDSQHWFQTNTTSNCIAPGFAVDRFCHGETTEFTSTPALPPGYLPDGASNVQWSFGDGATTPGANVTHRYSQPGTYEIVMTFNFDGTICGTPAEAGVHTIRKTVTIHALPSKPLITRGGDSLIADSAAAYQWNLNGNPIPGAVGRTFRPLVSGAYSVTVSNAGGCSTASDPTSVSSVDADDMRLGSVTIAPNPGAGRFRLEFARSAPHVLVVDVHDAAGRIVQRATIERGATACLIDLEGAPAGVYSASFALDGRVIARSFVNQR